MTGGRVAASDQARPRGNCRPSHRAWDASTPALLAGGKPCRARCSFGMASAHTDRSCRLWVHHAVSWTSAARVTASQPGRHALTHRPPPTACRLSPVARRPSRRAAARQQPAPRRLAAPRGHHHCLAPRRGGRSVSPSRRQRWPCLGQVCHRALTAPDQRGNSGR
ncbi:hypothetical protein FHY25_004027 [Xanthomonas arboricola]|nr:hypothetical protein [Xanthomonas campestris]MCW2009308.1 hypothetical protein [Xanthomonas campestris]